MLSASTPTQTLPSGEDSSGSDRGSEVSVGAPATETDRFGFILGNGSTAGSEGPPPELVRQRETKWINIISQWDRVLLKKSSKVKEQCQKGIPASLRAKCWPLLCGATDRMRHNKDLYQTLDSRPALQSWVDVIERDLDRQFPFHEMFLSRDGHGQRGLFRVLKAFTQLKPEEGYCQAQGPVAAVLLMNMPTEEAFWCLVQISEQYLPGYYSPLLEGVLFDAAMLTRVLKRTCPAAHKHLQRHGVEPLMFATDWLMCLFTRHLPFNTLLRVWDLFFCYGVRVLFQVAVVLVRRALGRVEQREACEGQMETLERLRGVREQVQKEDDTFIAEVCSVPLSSKDLERQTERELEKWRMERPASTFDPRGRCHGYRMAWARAQEMEEERNRKKREKGNLSLPPISSHSLLSLSPSLLRNRKKGSKTDTGECEGGNLRRGSEMDGSLVRAQGVPPPATEDRAPVEMREPLEHKEPLGQEDRSQKTQLTPDSDGEPSQQRQLTSDHSVTSQGQGEEQGGFSQTHASEQYSDSQTQETNHSKGTMQTQEVLNKQSTASANIITEHIVTETKGVETGTDEATETNTGIETAMESPNEIQRQTETAKIEVQYTEPSRITPANQSQVSPELTSTTEPEGERDSSGQDQKLPEEPQNPVRIHPEENQETQNVRESEGEKEEEVFTLPSQEDSTEILPSLHQGESLKADFPPIPGNPKSQSQSEKSESPPPTDSKAGSGNSVSTHADVSSQRTTPCDGPWATPSGDFRLCKSSSSRRLTRRLSEDLFTNPNQSQPTFTHSNQSNTGFIQSNQPQPTPPIHVPKHPESPQRVTGSTPATVPPQTGPTPDRGLTDTPRRFGLFRRHKDPVPKILIQDFSDGTGEGRTVKGKEEEEKLSSRERRRRRREQERREKEEEKLRKKREKELEKERKRERRKPQTRGKSFQVQPSNVPLPGNSGSQTFGSKRNSTPSMETYF
ncbi:hypothetical protein J4Q44_G00304560 [Coregonus suidteri]|uniref:Rab-GAP TBC domain-containing protein n=1 Tax=Coregonus suidteri TaxID=861788 RepID=A0AAN8L4H5_9TELE